LTVSKGYCLLVGVLGSRKTEKKSEAMSQGGALSLRGTEKVRPKG